VRIMTSTADGGDVKHRKRHSSASSNNQMTQHNTSNSSSSKRKDRESMSPTRKFVQRKLYSFIRTKLGMALCVIGLFYVLSTILHIFQTIVDQGTYAKCCLRRACVCCLLLLLLLLLRAILG
jgi:hypothetical protein